MLIYPRGFAGPHDVDNLLGATFRYPDDDKLGFMQEGGRVAVDHLGSYNFV